MKLFNQLKAMLQDESGISAVEYALLLALIGAGIAAAAFGLGEQVTENITGATADLAGAGG